MGSFFTFFFPFLRYGKKNRHLMEGGYGRKTHSHKIRAYRETEMYGNGTELFFSFLRQCAWGVWWALGGGFENELLWRKKRKKRWLRVKERKHRGRCTVLCLFSAVCSLCLFGSLLSLFALFAYRRELLDMDLDFCGLLFLLCLLSEAFALWCQSWMTFWSVVAHLMLFFFCFILFSSAWVFESLFSLTSFCFLFEVDTIYPFASLLC